MKRETPSWDDLQDRWASGEALSPSEELARREHALADPLAARELLTFAELRERVAGADVEHDTSDLYAGVLESVRGQARLRLVSEHDRAARLEVAAAPARRGRLVALGGAVAVVAAAAAALLLWARAPERSSQPVARSMPPASAPADVRTELLLAAGEVRLDGVDAQVGSGPLRVGQHVSTGRGRACLVVDPQIDVCLDADSEVVLDSLAESAVSVRVLRGTSIASLAPRARGHTFSLVSGDVSATARGTVFAVEREAAGATRVVVVEGHVEVAAAARPAAWLAPHSRIELDASAKASETALVGRSEEARLLALVAPRALWQDKALGMLEVAAGGAWLEASVEGFGPLALPLRTLLAAGAHRVVLRDAAGAVTSVEVEVAAGQTRRVEPIAASGAVPKNPASASAESASGLLEAARRELGRGGAKAALPLYQRLLATYPKSPEAFTVLVTVGQLELDQHAPAKALSSFDAYLRRGGGLAPEALAGKIRALRALGRAPEERAAIERYLKSYPSGFAADGLRQRLEAMP